MSVTSIVMKNQTNFGGGDATATSVAHTVGVVESPMTLNVGSGQEYTTLQEALDWIEARILLAEVTIQIANGTYNHSSGVGYTFDHPNYARVNILGNTSSPSSVAFNHSGSISSWLINGCRLKSLKGIKINGGTYCLAVTNQASITTLQNMELEYSTSVGLRVAGQSYVYCNYVNSHHHTNHGFVSADKSVITAVNPTSTNNQFGFVQSTGTIFTSGSVTVNNNSTADDNVTTLGVETTSGGLITGSWR